MPSVFLGRLSDEKDGVERAEAGRHAALVGVALLRPQHVAHLAVDKHLVRVTERKTRYGM